MRVIQVALLTPAVVIFSGRIETVPRCRAAELAEAAAKDEIIKDWMLQDYGHQTGKCFTDDENAEVEVRLIKTVLKELSPGAAEALQSEMDSLVHKKTTGNDPRWKALWIKITFQQRCIWRLLKI